MHVLKLVFSCSYTERLQDEKAFIGLLAKTRLAFFMWIPIHRQL